MQYSAHNGRGYSDLSQAFVLFNSPKVNARGCEVKYYQSAKSLYLLNDAGTAWLGPLAAGSAGTLSNSQCTVNGTGTSASGSGQTLTWILSVTASVTFTATKTAYMAVFDSEGAKSSWQDRGTWTP